MRVTLFAFLFLGLVACGQKPASTSSCSLDGLSGPYRNGQKLVISPMVPGASSMSGGGVGISSGAVDQTLQAGTELVATVKDSCRSSVLGNAKQPGSGAATPSGVHSVRWAIPETMTVSQLNNMIAADQCIVGLGDSVSMRVNDALTASLGYDEKASSQSHLAAIKAGESYQYFYDGSAGIQKDVTIAIIDTGVDIDHEDLAPNVWVNPNEIAGNLIDDDHNGYIDDVNGYDFASDNPDPRIKAQFTENFHGTHVAGLAAARGGNTVGGTGVMGKHGKIMALNVFGKNAAANNSYIDNAIRYAADNGADVINMSLGSGGATSSTQNAIAYAVSKGVTVVVAAGNSNTELGPNYFETPASYGSMYAGVISIGSTDAVTGKRSYFSNYGPDFVKLSAPGSDSNTGSGLLSTMPGNAYGRLQGTSMASPVAAGAAGLVVGMLRTRGYKAKPGLVEELLTTSANAIDSLKNYFNGGRAMDLKNLANLMSQRYPLNGIVPPGQQDDKVAGSTAPCGS